MDPAIEGAVIGAVGAVLAGAIAALVAVLGFRKSSKDNRETLTRTLEATRQGRFPERFSRAVEQLGSDKIDVRIGGIYALERISHDSEEDQWTVMEVLAAFIRDHSDEQWPKDPSKERSTRPDVQTAVAVVAHRDVERDAGRRIDLFEATLIRANLDHANLSGAILRYAKLTNAVLLDAIFTGADLRDVILDGARLDRADFTGARWSEDKLPEGWRLVAGSDRLERQPGPPSPGPPR